MEKDTPAILEDKEKSSPYAAGDATLRPAENAEGKVHEVSTTTESQSKVLGFWMWN